MSLLPRGGGSLGTTRNRTDVFLKYRNQARGVRPAAPDADNGKESSRCGLQPNTASSVAAAAHCVRRLNRRTVCRGHALSGPRSYAVNIASHVHFDAMVGRFELLRSPSTNGFQYGNTSHGASRFGSAR